MSREKTWCCSNCGHREDDEARPPARCPECGRARLYFLSLPRLSRWSLLEID
jgi:rubrerythrin